MRGACVVDRRPRGDRADGAAEDGGGVEGSVVVGEELEDDEQVASKTKTKAGGADEGEWLGGNGNRVWVLNESEWTERFGEVMMRRILGLDLE
jgi:hypothetical protein